MARKLCKVCGLTRAGDVELCSALGVDFTGFIFVPSSPRAVTPELAASLPRGPARRVGVFAGLPPEEMLAVADAAGLDLFQLHGGESPEVCARLGPERVIKVFWPETCSRGKLLEDMERFAPVCSFFLLDAGTGGGGSGTRVPFERLAGLETPRPWLLAGGLGPESLGPALASCSPDGVDLNSALEDAPGVKNPALLRRAVMVVNDL